MDELVFCPQSPYVLSMEVTLRPGETKTVSVTVSPRAMRTLGRDFKWRVEPGDFTLWLASDAEHPIMSRTFRVE